jgi:hypothetical protein
MGGGKLSDRSNRFLFLTSTLVPGLRCIFRADKGLCRRRNATSISITEVGTPEKGKSVAAQLVSAIKAR